MTKSMILVTLQVLISAALVLSAHYSRNNLPALTLTLLGIALGLWAIYTIGWRRVRVMPDVRGDTQLKTSGPYRWVRHPMYTALLVACLGLACAPAAPWKLVGLVVLAFVLTRKAEIEEQQLRKQFSDYDAYALRTKRFIPGVW